MSNKFTFEFAVEEMNVILGALDELANKVSRPIIDNIINQVNARNNPPPQPTTSIEIAPTPPADSSQG